MHIHTNRSSDKKRLKNMYICMRVLVSTNFQNLQKKNCFLCLAINFCQHVLKHLFFIYLQAIVASRLFYTLTVLLTLESR